MTATDFQKRLVELAVFTQPKLFFGIPRDLFFAVSAIVIGYGILISFFLSAFLALVLYPSLYVAHQTDPNAVRVWLQAFKSRTSIIVPMPVNSSLKYKFK